MSFHLTHTFDADLTISLMGPDGTMIDLTVENGGSANNYGSALLAAHVQDNLRRQRGQLDHRGSAPFVGIFRPEQPLSRFNGKSGTAANGTWRLSDRGFVRRRYRHASVLVDRDQHCAGIRSDFTGDGSDDIAVYRPSTGEWLVRNQGTVQFGLPSDVPVAGDYNGDRTTDRAVYRPQNGIWFVHDQATVQWGLPGDIPVAGDYNGDGTTDRAVYRPQNGFWFVHNQASVQWGVPGDIPVPGDYNGDGTTDVAMYRPATAEWWVPNHAVVVWGVAGDIPVPGDYNGDGMTDRAVFRPSTGEWWVQGQAPVQWGLHGDIPVPATTTATGRWITPCIGRRPASGSCPIRPRCSGGSPAMYRCPEQ